ncbi:hypothetical protein PG637_06730 [Riemerella anatipestifer]|nr:hypothetical protein [Riemerella anatipestifer]MDY3325365.1 hypothetical protein [Riemerella anatipestifer]MDY3352645.1 hypothetical protein [Riemerella anatipestifer]
MAKLKYTVLLLLVVLLSPSISAQNNGGWYPSPDSGGSGGVGFDVGVPEDVPDPGGGVGFDVGVPEPPDTPIDLYSIELALLAVGFILVTSYYLRKRQLKSL